MDLSAYRGLVPVELMDGTSFPPVGPAPYVLTLPAYGHFWFALAEASALPRWHMPAPQPLPALVTLVVGDHWKSLLTGREGSHLDRNVLPDYLPRQRWFGSKNEKIKNVAVTPLAALAGAENNQVLATLRVDLENGENHTYAMPMLMNWGPHSELTASQRGFALAKVRRGPRVGTLLDAATEESFFATLLEKLRAGEVIPAEHGEIRFSGNALLADVPTNHAAKVLQIEQSNASGVVGENILVKFYRRLESGLQPEIEMAQFLSEHAHYGHTPKFLGCVEHIAGSERTALAGAFQFVHNQGDAWHVVTSAIERMLEEYGLGGDVTELPELAFPLNIGGMLGRRTAELHLALATPTEDQAFAAEQVGADDIERWANDSRAEADRTFAALDKARAAQIPESGLECISLLQAHKGRIERLLEACRRLKPSGQKIRHHGDFHLGQVLIVKDDLMIVDFEGEPTRTLEERRRKTSPLRDLAGMLRSLDYAAWAALDRVTALGVTSPDQMRALAFAWRDRAIEDCVAEYIKTASASAIYPDHKETAAGLLYVFLLRKALYEVRYEVGSRPDWLSIPVRGIVNLLDSIGIDP